MHLYVHVPFCARRCSYCDFAIAVRRQTPVGEYVSALQRELSIRAPRDGPWSLETVYLGGGTPSRLGAEGVARVLDLIRRHGVIAAGAEVTIEANPDDVTAAAARGWIEAGVNRLSLGAQTFDDRVLRWMHRTHDAASVDRAVREARNAGIGNLSLDLIFALPESLERDWARDLERAIALTPEHISLYGLTVEHGTPLGRWRERGDVTEAPDERYERDFLLAHESLSAAGFDHYEVSNYGRPGRRAVHNSAYWQRRPYVGLGPSAHSYDGVRRRWNVSAYAEWVRRLERGADPVAEQEQLSDEDRALEDAYLDLRTTEGIALGPGQRSQVRSWIEAGWAVFDGDRLRLTPLGWLRLDALVGSLTVIGSRC